MDLESQWFHGKHFCCLLLKCKVSSGIKIGIWSKLTLLPILVVKILLGGGWILLLGGWLLLLLGGGWILLLGGGWILLLGGGWLLLLGGGWLLLLGGGWILLLFVWLDSLFFHQDFYYFENDHLENKYHISHK